MQSAWQHIIKIPGQVAIFLIRCYQVTLSPHIPGCCRYEPSCSQYGIEAIQKHGFIKGLRLAAGRIARCRPGGGHGYDPVP